MSIVPMYHELFIVLQDIDDVYSYQIYIYMYICSIRCTHEEYYIYIYIMHSMCAYIILHTHIYNIHREVKKGHNIDTYTYLHGKNVCKVHQSTVRSISQASFYVHPGQYITGKYWEYTMSSLVNYIIWLLPSYNSWDAMEEAGSRVFTRSHSKTLFTWLSITPDIQSKMGHIPLIKDLPQ